MDLKKKVEDERYKIMGCVVCGGNKKSTTHSFGTYRVYFNGDILKLKCKTCNHVVKFRIIRGGV